MKRIVIGLFTLFIALYGYTQSVEIESFIIDKPIIRNIDTNPVLHLIISAETEQVIEEISFDLRGSSDIGDIKQIQFYQTKNDPVFNDKHLISETKKIKRKVKFSEVLRLVKGNNHLWVSMNLTDNCDLLHTFKIKLHNLKFKSNTKIILKSYPNDILRAGHAIARHKDNGVDTYRIPGLATTNNGTLIAVYDMRYSSSYDLQEDVDIGMSRSTDGGESWESNKVIMDMGSWGGKPDNENGIGDPSILIDRTNNNIWVAAVWAHGHPGERNWWASKPGLSPQETSQLMLVKSEDDGINWSQPINITMQVKDPSWQLLLQGPGKGITRKDGTIIFPAQFKDSIQMPYATIIYSKDKGIHWEIGKGIKSNTTESQIAELSNGEIMINARDNRNGKVKDDQNGRAIYLTKDLGETWQIHPSSNKELIEPVCMASLHKHIYNGRDIIFFSNPNSKFKRENMTIKISFDNGNSWPDKDWILLDSGGGRGYSCLTSINENTIGILYEGSRADLIFQKVKFDEIIK